jgi:hypothetical protein
MKAQNTSKVTIDLSMELTANELRSFREQAEKAGLSLRDHLHSIVFGERSKPSDKGAVA